MSNDLQYVVAQVAPYLVAAAGHLRYLGVNLEELVTVKIEQGELGDKVWLPKDEKCKFEEHYAVLAGEKSVVEDQVVGLDKEVECLSQQMQDLVDAKEALEVCVREQSEQLVVKELMRRALEKDLSWFLSEVILTQGLCWP